MRKLPTFQKPNGTRQVLANAGAIKLKATTETRRRPLKRAFPLCVEAISITCGGALVDQLRPFVLQAQFYQPECRLHIATDLRGYERINDLIREQDAVWIIKGRDLRHYAELSSQPDHGHRWSKGWIGIKLENFRRAVESWQCGVLQCDSDFIFTRSLPKINWQADLVMSTHCGPLLRQDVPMAHGYYNAGLLLTDQLFVVEDWIKRYQRGDGGFYEQKLLEQFAEKYVIGLFPDDWNWGPWRHHEDVKFNGRVPAIIHAHVSGPHRQQNSLHDVADRETLINCASYNTHGQWAFYHCSKAAGSEVDRLIHEVVCKRVRYQPLNSFAQPGRLTDWSEKELLEMCYGVHKYQQGNRWIVHNHGQGWADDMQRYYLERGWKFFAFYRPIRERLCSFYSWSINMLQKHGQHPMSGPITVAMTIDDFFELLVKDEQYVNEWQLPLYADSFQWYAANDSGMVTWARECFNLKLSYSDLSKTNTSPNLGWDYYVNKGLIKEATVELVNGLPMIQEWDKFIAQHETGKAKRNI